MPRPQSLITVTETVPVKELFRPDEDAIAQARDALATAAMTFSLKVLTVNIHKGFTFFNRKFILPELREAVRSVGADVVFLQEVTGSNEKHLEKFDHYPETPHYEFLADSIWPQFAYGRNAVYTHGDHGCLNFPSCVLKTTTSPSAAPKGAACCIANCKSLAAA
jgi:hypothetical protein